MSNETQETAVVVAGEERVVLEASALGGEAAGEVLIAPWGLVESANGSFVVDEEAGRLTIEAFAGHGTDLPVDYEHQSLGGKYSSPDGQAPAAGWIRSLQLVTPGEAAGEGSSEEPCRAKPPGLYAEVEWTERARAKLLAREYRYLSPVVIIRKLDRRVVALHSAALTNKPAIVGMRPIVNREERSVGANVENRASDDGFEVLRLRLGLSDGCEPGEMAIAAERRIGELEEMVRRREAEDRVAEAVRSGKLTPAQREWAMSLAMRDPAGFDEWAASAPVVVLLGRTEAPSGAGVNRRREAIAASARAAYRAEPSLALLTSEVAWVEQAVREAGGGEENAE